MALHYNKNTKLTTTESVEREIIELPVDNVNTEEEMDFGELTIPGAKKPTEITEFKLDDELLDNVDVHSTEKTELNITESVTI